MSTKVEASTLRVVTERGRVAHIVLIEWSEPRPELWLACGKRLSAATRRAPQHMRTCKQCDERARRFSEAP